jgi:hypothetical protein
MSYQVKKYRHNKSTEQQIIESILKALWWLISAPFKLIFKKRNPGTRQTPENISIDRQFVMAKWQEIDQLIVLGQPSNYQRAVLEADKLLDHLLKGHRAPGLTMGDRLKASEHRFSREAYNAAWNGHKVRNEIVHNAEYQMTNFIARAAIENFKKAIEELV